MQVGGHRVDEEAGGAVPGGVQVHGDDADEHDEPAGQGLVLATDAVERYVVDGAIEGAATGTGALGRLTRRTESGYVRSYAGYMLAGTVLVLIAVLAARF